VTCRTPLLFQNREVKLVAPPALKPLVLDEVRLLPHPEPGCQTSRTVIFGIDPGHHAVKAEVVERQMQYPVRGFGRVALAREGRIEDVADLPAAVLSRMPHQDDVAYQLARFIEFHPESQCLSFGFEGLAGPHPMHALADSGGVHRLKRDVPADLRKRSVGDKRLDVLLGERTKGQPGGAKGIARVKRHGRTGCPNCRPQPFRRAVWRGGKRLTRWQTGPALRKTLEAATAPAGRTESVSSSTAVAPAWRRWGRLTSA
jgi:hypothetical protein